ncbi:hypothetical protein JCM11491_002293 [Sporobolomyces phaffii]
MDPTAPAPPPPLPLEPAPAKPSPKSSTTFNEDVVQVTLPDGTTSVAVVTRCWADEQNPDALAEAKRLGIDFTPLQTGYLEVLHPDGSRTEVLESATQLVDRGFLRGDIVRPARPTGTLPLATKPQAGSIVEIKSEVELERVLEPHDKLEGWFDTDRLVASARINRGDHVVYGEWVGLVEEVFEMAMIETGSGSLRRVCDVGTNLSVGPATEAVKAMLMERTGGFLSNFLGTNDVKTILDIKQLSVAINWLCRNPLAPTTDGETDWQRPKRYWTDLDSLKLVRATADHLRTIHDKLVPRDPSEFPAPAPSRHLSTFPDAFQIYTVTNSRSTLTVLWQDGTTTTGPSSAFEQVHVLDDETEVFPGDVGLFSGVTPSRCAVVQSMDSRKRTVKLRYLNAATGAADAAHPDEEIVSAMEFDPHGPPQHEYGVRRGDWVLIAKESEGNGVAVPEVPSLGESETAAGLMPANEELRIQLSSLGLSYAQNLPDSFVPPRAETSPASVASIRWYAEVWDLQLDGLALLRFPDGTKQSFPISRLYHLDDGMDPHGDMMHAHDDDLAGSGAEHDHDMMVDGDDGWTTESDGDDSELSAADVDMDADEGDASEREGEGATEVRPENGAPSRKRKRGRRESRGWADDDDDEDDEGAAAATRTNPKGEEAGIVETANAGLETPSTQTETPVEQRQGAPAEGTAAVSMPADVEDIEDWKRFEVLEEVPIDHHYSGEVVQVPSKSFMSRVRKEHGVLASSLPPNILVRAYESRLDLMRCLIIGPPGTPFQNAPFLFDLFLSPSKFPQEPPQVFFHSWAGGTRVSPNLYAEGKVCLSLLGTWSGDKTESWSSARSSILQILISIQGLIMVEDPYFTEPGFEKQIGTAEGTTASELYNERTLVLTRNFVKRACEYPPANFEREVAHYFYSDASGALKAIVDQSRALLEESDAWHAATATATATATAQAGANDADADADADADETAVAKPRQSEVVPSQRVLSEGGAISLRRTLKGLEELQERGPKLA